MPEYNKKLCLMIALTMLLSIEAPAIAQSSASRQALKQQQQRAREAQAQQVHMPSHKPGDRANRKLD